MPAQTYIDRNLLMLRERRAPDRRIPLWAAMRRREHQRRLHLITERLQPV